LPKRQRKAATEEEEADPPKRGEKTNHGRSVAQDAKHSPQQQQHVPKNDPTLHPSWQARKDKKDCIVAFQGKKITF
jgi:BUD22